MIRPPGFYARPLVHGLACAPQWLPVFFAVVGTLPVGTSQVATLDVDQRIDGRRNHQRIDQLMDVDQYDGMGGRPVAHLVIAWPHGVPVVDAMVEAFHAGRANMTVKGQPVECCDMTVASLVNAEMRNASELLACIYATETAGPKAEWRIKQKSVCPSPSPVRKV